MRVTAFRAALLAAVMAPVALSSQDQTVRIRVAKALDGTGKVLSNVTITIQGSKITSIGTGQFGRRDVQPGHPHRDARHDRRARARRLAFRQGRALRRQAGHAGTRDSL